MLPPGEIIDSTKITIITLNLLGIDFLGFANHFGSQMGSALGAHLGGLFGSKVDKVFEPQGPHGAKFLYS